jgi:KDO2-lipid IV(A) lauroyltransferase
MPAGRANAACVTLTNLGLCFPQLSAGQKSALARRHFMAFGRSIVELGLWWWALGRRASAAWCASRVAIRLAEYKGKPVILLVPHFVGIDAGWIRMALEQGLVAIYTRQKNRSLRGGDPHRRPPALRQLRTAASRQEGTRKALKAMKAGRFFHYSPDMDYGPEGIGLRPLLRRANRHHHRPVAAGEAHRRHRDPGYHAHGSQRGYVARVGEPWTAFPSGDDDVADARRLNAFIEAEVERSPEQYYWLHKRFKTRPAGEARFY